MYIKLMIQTSKTKEVDDDGNLLGASIVETIPFWYPKVLTKRLMKTLLKLFSKKL